MKNALSVTWIALGLWWREFILFFFFNIAWLILQIPIVTGPPATAAMYVLARRLSREELIYPIHGWLALRQTFLPALKWGAVNLIVVSALVINYWAYQANSGFVWQLIRYAWGAIGLGWFAINLFYWPFWLAQEDRSFLLALRNGSLFIIKRPVFTLTLVLLCVILIVVSILTTLPLATVLMAWIALISVIAVEQELETHG